MGLWGLGRARAGDVQLVVDSHVGTEYVLHGSSSMLQTDLGHAFELSLRIHQSNQDASLQEELSNLIKLEPGTPVGCASGRKKLKHKVHALIHATRLRVSDWKSVATFMNSSVTITGDLGERNAVLFHHDLRQFMGPWVEAEDLLETRNPGRNKQGQPRKPREP